MASCARLFCVFLIAGIPACSDDGTKTDASNRIPPDAAPEESGTPDLPALPSNVALPIIFLHGFVGSAQQYESQAIRFVANGYPRERIQAIDHHGVSPDTNALMADVVALGERLCTEAGVDNFFLVGHSRGTSMSNTFL